MFTVSCIFVDAHIYLLMNVHAWHTQTNEYTSYKGSFKCYVMLEGVGGYMSKRYAALRGVGGGYVSVT